MVLIWLSPRNTFKFHCTTDGNHPKNIPKHHSTNGVHHGPIEEFILRDLCRREYWKRLWIIQETGKATRLRIHYHSTTTEWDRFMKNVNTLPEFANDIPLRLEAQLRGPYDERLTLSSLVRANQDALCKDPRDKIYGLLGLAIDVDEKFPIDYSKSLFEVFKDTIFHQNKDETRSQYDILEMSRLLARILGGTNGLERDKPAGNFDGGDISIESSSGRTDGLRIPGRLVGRIKHVGPFCSEIIARIEKSMEWRALINGDIPNKRLRAAVIEQSDIFVKMLEDFEETSQTTIFTFNRCIRWKGFEQSSTTYFKGNYGSSVGTAAISPAKPSSVGCRLFLLQPFARESTSSWMGLAPCGTQVGDFVCHIPSIERAVIVRQSLETDSSTAQYTYELIGCAGLARNRDTGRQVVGKQLSPSGLFDTAELSAPSSEENFNLYVDIYAAHEISS